MPKQMVYKKGILRKTPPRLSGMEQDLRQRRVLSQNDGFLTGVQRLLQRIQGQSKLIKLLLSAVS